MSRRPAVVPVVVGLGLALSAAVAVALPAAALPAGTGALPAALPAAGALPAARPEKVTGVLADRAGVLGEQADDVEAALVRLGDDTALDLTVVIVDDFDDWEPRDWADASAVASSLRQNDGLLAIAVDDAAYGLSLDERFPVADDARAAIEREVADLVAAHDWAGAATTAADGYRQAWLDARRAGTARAQAPAGTGAGRDRFPWLPAALGAAALVAAGVLLARRSASRTGAAGAVAGDARPDGVAALPTAELAALAARGLVAVDDAVEASAAELAAAQAQLGDVGHFADVLADARRSLADAFALHRRLAAAPDDAARRGLLLEVVRLCRAVDAALDARAAGLAALRALDARAVEVLAAVEGRAEALTSAYGADDRPAGGPVPPARPGRPAPGGLKPADTAHLLDRAQALLAAARQDAAAGRAAAADDPATAARLARAAERAVARAAVLLDAIHGMSQVERRAARAADATGAPDAPDASSDLAGSATSSATGADSEDLGDLLPEVLRDVTATVCAVGAVVEADRSAVGAGARTRLATARHLLAAARAAADDDAVVALADARQARLEATEALREALGDVDRARITHLAGSAADVGPTATRSGRRPVGWGGSGGGWEGSGGQRRPSVHNLAITGTGAVAEG